MTANLLHNAIVHNVPAEGSRLGHHERRLRHGGAHRGEHRRGTPPQLASTLVEPFQRGTARVRTDHAGVGLGLAIVKSIVEAHEGTVALTPRPGGGLIVTVWVPAAATAR